LGIRESVKQTIHPRWSDIGVVIDEGEDVTRDMQETDVAGLGHMTGALREGNPACERILVDDLGGQVVTASVDYDHLHGQHLELPEVSEAIVNVVGSAERDDYH
jgi:hypothetical protein